MVNVKYLAFENTTFDASKKSPSGTKRTVSEAWDVIAFATQLVYANLIAGAILVELSATAP